MTSNFLVSKVVKGGMSEVCFFFFFLSDGIRLLWRRHGFFPYYVKILGMESGRHYLAAIKPKNQGFSGGASGKN